MTRRKILILAANPIDTPRVRLDREVREIEEGLKRSQRRDEFEIKPQLAARPIDVRRAVLEFEPHIVHFCGHGAGEEGVVFEDEVSEAKLVSTEALSGFFELFADKVECVILNACYSEVQAEAIARYIRYVIGMKRAIGDDAAVEFAVAFYDALGAGKSIEFAYKLACNAIEWAGLPEHQIPVLKSGAPSQRSLPRVWSVPHYRNPNFIGRDGLLGEIRASFGSTQATTVVQALRGLGGVGKTQLAVEYAYRYADEYSYVWWVRAEMESSLERINFKPAIVADYISFGKAVGLAVESVTDQGEAVRMVREWLEDHTGWLLVFDNATDADSLRRFVPRGATGHTIITSRNPYWRGLAHTLTIGVLEGGDSVRLILQATGQSDSDTASELGYALGDLPLALSQATAYIEKTGIPLARYLELFRSRRRELQRREDHPGDYPDTVATTWLINVQIISRQLPEAVGLLSLISFLGPDAIPLSLLKYKPSLLPGSLSGLVEDDLRIYDAIASLRSYSLVEAFGESISLHRLVQAITRDNLSDVEFERWAAAAIQLVRASFPKNSDKVETRDTCARLLPHALASAGHASKHNLEPIAASWLYNQVGLHLMLIGDFESAESILRRALDIADGKIGDTEYDRSRGPSSESK